MRVETTGFNKGFDNVKPVQSGLQLKQGETITATVLYKEAGSVVLKRDDGLVFRAELLAEGLLLEHDTVELLVSKSTPEALICRLVFAEPLQKQALSAKPLNLEADPLFEAFKALGIAPSEKMLALAKHLINDIKLNTSEAIFFAANHIDADAAAHASFAALVEGATIGEGLNALYESAVSCELENVEGALEQNLESVKTQAEQAPLFTGTREQAAPLKGDIGQPPVENTEPMMQQITREYSKAEKINLPPAANLEAQNGKTQSAQTEPSIGARGLSTANEAAPLPLSLPALDEVKAENLKYEANVSEANNKKAGADLKTRIRGFFTATDEASAENLKESASLFGEKLNALEAYIKNSDTYNKRPVLEKLSTLFSQSKLLDGVSRFISMHIPFNYEAKSTAELYVYKRNRKGAKLDPENLSAVLALNTSSMGRVEAHIQLKKRSVSLKFHIENENSIPLFLEKSTELANALGRNYSLAQFSASSLKENTTLENAEASLNNMMKAEASMLDLRV